MGPLEKDEEAKFCRWARKEGFLVRKMNGLSERHWPDRMILGQGKVLFLEFKRQGGKLTPGQEAMIDELREAGFAADVVHSCEEAKYAVEEWFT